MSEEQKQEVSENQEPVAEEAKDKAPESETVTAETEPSTAEDASKEEEQEKKSSEPDWKDAYARLLADFDNFKKRTARDREDTYRFAEGQILCDVLPTVDNLALALKNAKNPEDDFVKGVNLVYESLLAALKNHDAEPFDSKGADLDVEKMEAIATLPSDDVEEGKVSEEVKRGWMHKGRGLRAAQVVVSSGKKA
jgi:molecular chaperone GrpE